MPKPTRKVRQMKTLLPSPPKVDHDFADDRLTGFGGASALAAMAKRMGLFRALADAVSVKTRRRGPSDSSMLWALIASLASGNGALSDLDRLRADPSARKMLGLRECPSGRRMGEFLSKMAKSDIEGLEGAARMLAAQVALEIVRHEVEEQGFAHVFPDGTCIEVDGKLFEGAEKNYNGDRSLLMHAVFIGRLWASGRLHPGGVHVAHGWKKQMEEDIAHLIPEGTPVWARADNAYYGKAFANHCKSMGWDYSISVTNPNNKRPVLEAADGLPDEAWEDIGMCEEAVIVRHRPSGWKERPCIVIRKFNERDGARDMFPTFAVIAVSREDLPIADMVRRHRGKQGQENAFKGPLRDMDLHHPPCRSLASNRAFYLCGQIAQMLLLAVQYKLLPKTARKHGLRAIIRDIMGAVAKLVTSSGRRLKLLFGRSNFRLDWLCSMSIQLE